MSIGKSIKVDGQGNVDTVTEATSTLRPIKEVRKSGNVLSFSYEDDSHERQQVRVATHRTPTPLRD